MFMKQTYTPLNIEKLKKKHYYVRDRRFDVVLVVIGLLTIGVHVGFISVLIQRQAPVPIASINQVKESLSPTVTPYESQLATITKQLASENTLGASTTAQLTSTPSATMSITPTSVKKL